MWLKKKKPCHVREDTAGPRGAGYSGTGVDHWDPYSTAVRRTFHSYKTQENKCFSSFYWTEFFWFNLWTRPHTYDSIQITRIAAKFHTPVLSLSLAEGAYPGAPRPWSLNWAVLRSTSSALDLEHLVKQLTGVFLLYCTIFPLPIFHSLLEN